MKNITKFFHAFAYELIGLLIFTVVTLMLFAINQVAGFIALAAVVIYSIVLIILFKMGKYGFARDIDGNGIAQMIAGLTEKIDSPVMVVNEANRIVWSNDEFNALTEVSEMRLSAGMGKLFEGKASYANLSGAHEQFIDFLPIVTDGYSYNVRSFPIEFHKQRLFGAIWYSSDEEYRLKRDLEDSAVRIAYIVIDNTNEVSQEVKENLRFGSAIVNKLLTEWAAQFNGILTEYDRDKYVMQFENKYFKSMVEAKFDILDKVVKYSLEESPIPITISIGISDSCGTLSEKRDVAQASLRSALQRGGSLVVVRTENGEDSFGGRTKAVQRQTKIRSRLCRDLLVENLKSCSNVIIMGHTRPDFDSIASNIGISKLVRLYDKEYCIVADRNDRNISKIIDSIAMLPEYDNVFVDEVYAQEQLTPNTLVIITDASNPDLFAARGVYENASKVIVIDHHAIKETLGEQVLPLSNIDPTASSASELVCEILELTVNPIDLHPEEAQVLLAGILLDTQFFARDTGTRTYSACIFLKNAGAEAGKAKRLFKSDMNESKSVARIEQNLEVYREKFAISTYTDNNNPENKVIASKAADRMVDIDGVSASFVLYALDNGINLSARSDGSVNVINIAKSLGGGGHFQSAGALIRKKNGKDFVNPIYDIDEAMEVLKAAIDEYIGEDMKEVRS